MSPLEIAQFLGSIGEFVGAIAVVVTLIYVARQLKQNTASVGASAYQMWVGANLDLNISTADQGMSKVVARGIYDSSIFSQQPRWPRSRWPAVPVMSRRRRAPGHRQLCQYLPRPQRLRQRQPTFQRRVMCRRRAVRRRRSRLRCLMSERALELTAPDRPTIAGALPRRRL